MSRSTFRPKRGVFSYMFGEGSAPASTDAGAPSPAAGRDEAVRAISNPASGPVMTRRAVLKTMLGVTVLGAAALGNPLRSLAAEATQETLDALDAAQQAYNDAQAKLGEISDQYVQLNQQLNDTVTKIETVQGQIDNKQKEIEAKQAELDDKQDQLSRRLSASYKTGSSDFLSVLFNSATFEELTSNLTYMGKINASDEQLIADVKQAKADLDQQKAELEDQKSELEQLKEEQTQQLAAVQAKQDEATALVGSLSQDVKDLIAKRDQEILAAAEEERRQAEAAAAAAAAAKAARQAAQSSGGGGGGVTGSLSGASASTKGAAIVSACGRVGSPGVGLCAMWVSRVYNAAGLGYPGGNANNMYWNFCTSSNKGDLQPGMIVAVSTYAGGSSAGRTYGHVGIYVGNGTVMDNVGYIRTIGLDSWISSYGNIVTPRWGWAA